MPRKKTTSRKKVVQGVHIEKENSNIPLDQLMGERINNPFPTTSEAEFEKLLEEMDLLDMEELGTKVYLRPVHDRRVMKQRLIKEFKVTMAKVRHAAMAEAQTNKNKPLPTKRQKTTDSILREGR